MVPTAYPSHHPKQHVKLSIGSAVLVWVPNAMVYNALSVGKKTPKAATSPWDFVTLPEDDRATAIGNMHRKIAKECACRSGDILTDRQTHTHIHMCSYNTSPQFPRVK